MLLSNQLYLDPFLQLGCAEDVRYVKLVTSGALEH